MGLTKLIVLLLGLAAVSFAVKYALEGTAPVSVPGLPDAPRSKSSAHTRPKEQLDNVREKAHDLERQMQKAADDVGRSAEQR